MTFLNTAILFGLLAGAIPIIIHLLTRQKAKTVLFSSLRFLKELENQQIRRLKIRQLLILILRTLIVLLLVLAFARPTLKGKVFSGLGTKAKTSAVVILDNSMSMGVKANGQQLYDVVKKAALALSDVFVVGDEIYAIYSTVGTPPIYDGVRYSFETVSKIINKSKVSQSRTDLTSALIEAKNLLRKSNNINKEIYLISDLQQTGVKKLKETLLPIISDDKIRLFVIQIDNNLQQNLVITEVKPVNQIIEKGKVFQLDAVIKNTGQQEMRNRLVQLFVDGKRTGQATIALKSGESRAVKFRIVPDKTGLIAGSALLEDDDLFLDNRRFFTFYVPDRMNVLLISDHRKDVKFLELALNPGRDQHSQIKTSFLTPGQIKYGSLKDYQVVILSNVPRVDGTLLTSLLNHLEDGGGVIIFLGDEVDLRNYNEKLNSKLNLPRFTETIGQIGSKEFNVSLGKIDLSHPIFSGVFEEKKAQIASPLFYFLTKVNTQPANDVIMAFSNGAPFLLESRAKNGKVMLFTTAIDPEWSDLYLKGVFVPLMNRCVAYLANNAAKSEERYLVNDELTTVVPDVGDLVDIKIETPDGKFSKVVPRAGVGSFTVKFRESQKAGIYSLYKGDQLLTRWAVNFDPEESEIVPLGSDEIDSVFGKNKRISYKDNPSLVRDVKTTRYGRELWKYFVGLAALFLIIEMILSREPGEQVIKIETERFERAN